MGTKAEVIARAPSAQPRRILGLVSISHGAQHMYSALLPLTYPGVLLAFHISVGTLGLAVGLMGVMGGLSQASAGAVSRRVQARWVFGGQNIVLGLCSILGGWSPFYAAYATGQGCAQLATSQQHPLGSSVAARVYPQRRGMALSTHTIGGSVGSLIVPLPAAAIIAHFGWRAALTFLSAPLLLIGVIFLLTFPMLELERPATTPAGETRLRLPRLNPKDLIDPKLVAFGIMAATVAAGGRGLGTLNTFVPLFLRQQLHFPVILTGVIFNLMLVGAVAGPLIGGWLSDRMGRLPVLWAAYALSAVAVIAFALLAHLGPAAAALLAVGMGLVAYAENPLLQALVSDGVAPDAQSRVFGYYFAIAYGFGSLWLIGLGAAIEHLGYTAGFAMMAVSYVGAGAMLVPVRSRRRGRRA